MTRDEKIRYVADSIIGSCLSEAEAREINGGVGWHPDDVEGEGIFRLSEDDLRAAIVIATRGKETSK
jgi:hypothetical protein